MSKIDQTIRHFIKSFPQALALTDKDGTVLEYSPHWLALNGHAPEDTLNQPIRFTSNTMNTIGKNSPNMPAAIKKNSVGK